MKNYMIDDSQGEKIIKAYLQEKRYYFKQHFTMYNGDKWYYPDFVIGYLLPEDLNRMDEFIFPDEVMVIEFDGKPNHFEAFSSFGGLKGFVERHFSDIEKDRFFESMGFPLLHISYKQIDSIQERLDHFFGNPDFYIEEHSREDWNNYYYEWEQNYLHYRGIQGPFDNMDYIMEYFKVKSGNVSDFPNCSK